MSAILPGYNYDIFISYRKKDNKHDGWVTEFVDNLKGELESTFKEEISVYFDINPHDGLLETHDVDESLKEKLKCLIFIPIISRTYCDPKSFAWEHEFKGFVEMASKDQLGLKVKLPDGNVTSRVLPVQIHELDNDDMKLLENELGGHLRGIEFIYREPGVDRSLKPEDKEESNINRTKYNNQINKVANAIKSIISGLKNKVDINEPEINIPEVSIESKKSRAIYIAGSIILVLLLFYGIFIFRKKNSETLVKSIAVLPFINDTPADTNQYFFNGVMVAILNNLQKINDLTVLSRTSTDQFNENRPSIPVIAKKLRVNYIVEGSGQKSGEKYMLRVQLFKGRKEKPLWGNAYEREIKHASDVFDVQNDIAEAIASELAVTLTPEEKARIEKNPTQNLTALDFYQRGKSEESNFTDDPNNPALIRAEEHYKKAVSFDSAFAPAYLGLASVYYFKKYKEEYFQGNFLDSFLILINKALSLDDKLAEAYYLKGEYYNQVGNSELALEGYNKCLKYNPNFCQAYRSLATLIYNDSWEHADYVKALEYIEKAINLDQGKNRPALVRDLGEILGVQAGFPDLAEKCFEKALAIDNDSMKHYFYLTYLYLFTDNVKSYRYARKRYDLNPDNMDAACAIAFNLDCLGEYKRALTYHKEYASWLKSTNQLGEVKMLRVGYSYWKNGNKKEADYWLNKQKYFDLKSIENKRSLSSVMLNAYYDLSCVYAYEGKKDSAYINLRRLDVMTVFPAWWLSMIKVDPFFEILREEEEFRNIVNRLEYKYQAEHERVKKWLEENDYTLKQILDL